MSAIHDVECDTGMPPVSSMGGSNPSKVAVPKEVAPLLPMNVAAPPPLEAVVDHNSAKAKSLVQAANAPCKKNGMFERRQRVRYTIDW